MPTLPLSEAAFVTLDGSGNGTARIGPGAHGVAWKPTVTGVRTSTSVLSPQCRIYAGDRVTDANFIDGTFVGQQNSSDAIAGQVLLLGQYVFAVWVGGDAGAQATLTVTGRKDIG